VLFRLSSSKNLRRRAREEGEKIIRESGEQQPITTINYHDDHPAVISVLYKQYLNTSVKYIFI